MHQKYLENVGQYDVLSREDEHKLALKMKGGDKTAREILINSNLRFVIRIAKQYANNENFEDLVQAGNIGLTEAADKFNPESGCRFITYAYYWILQEILDYYKKCGPVRLPEEKRQLIKQANIIIQRISANNGHEPDAKTIAKALGPEYSGKDVKDALEADRVQNMLSLNRPIGNESELELLDSIGIDNTNEIVKNIHYKSLAELVRKAIIGLSAREDIKHVLISVLFDKKSFKELSDEMGVKAKQIKQNYNIGIRLLRKSPQLFKNPALEI